MYCWVSGMCMMCWYDTRWRSGHFCPAVDITDKLVSVQFCVWRQSHESATTAPGSVECSFCSPAFRWLDRWLDGIMLLTVCPVIQLTRGNGDSVAETQAEVDGAVTVGHRLSLPATWSHWLLQSVLTHASLTTTGLRSPWVTVNIIVCCHWRDYSLTFLSLVFTLLSSSLLF